MSAMIAHREGPSSGGRLTESPGTPYSSRNDLSGHSSKGRSSDSDARRILIVDDDPVVLKLVSKMAASLGYRPAIAEDGVDALYQLTKSHYDLVITDYDMPFIDGYSLADQIKEKHFGTRVIIMTGHCEREVKELMEGSGIVDGMLLKPFNLTTMKEVIEKAASPRFLWR